MSETRIKINSIIENQIPQYIREEFPLTGEFLSQYYTSLDSKGGTNDILQNIDQYIKVDNLTKLIESTTLSSDVTFVDSTIIVESTTGFPDSYGILLIDSEIITYTSKTSTTFDGCVRGFNGITSYKKNDELIFTNSFSQEHSILDSEGNPTKVINLSILFLKEFFIKIKKQFTPGFDDRKLYSELNQNIFIKHSIDFYSSKGTDNSFKILFKSLYGENVDVIRPRDYLIIPSSAQYRVTKDLIVQKIDGDPERLINQTLYQDKDEFINEAQGTITNVEKIQRNNKEYYSISLDFGYDRDIQPSGSIYGNFTIHSKTEAVSLVLSGSSSIEVDSTVGFPKENGKIIVDLENGTSLNIVYSQKTLNQFIGCSGISQDIPEGSEIKLDSYAYGYVGTDKIKVRVLGVLSNLNIPENVILSTENNLIKIKTLGVDDKNYQSNNWFFNIRASYKVSSIDRENNSDRTYTINTIDPHSLHIGDSVTLLSSGGIEKNGDVVFCNGKKSFVVTFGSDQFSVGEELDQNLTYNITKNLSKVNTEKFLNANQYTSNVQNVYLDNDKNLYVSSPSIPSYLNKTLLVDDRSIIFSGSFQPDNESDLNIGTTLDLKTNHGLYTGDSIVYKSYSSDDNLGIQSGVYFIKKISGSDTKIKLSKSRNDINDEKFVSIASTSVNNAKFNLFKFTNEELNPKTLESQKLIRKISIPENDSYSYKTNPGLTGIFINGVELLNYKSRDAIYFGELKKITPTSSGSGYDVINPPELNIFDSSGFGAKGYCSVKGKLEKINIIDSGFDYLENPIITVTGGNGFGASAKANLISFEHSVEFSSQVTADLVKLSPINTIGFSTYHKFKNYEEVIYITNGQKSITGLTTNSSYFISAENPQNIKLYSSFSDAVAGINTVELTSFGNGNHKFKSKIKKKKLESITIQNSGSNYQNKLTTTNLSGINTASNVITIPNHGYQSGELITYDATETSIGGLTSSRTYYLTKVDENQFKLSEVGISTLGFTSSFYFDTKQFIDLTSTGSGIHKFNYPKINVSISGRTGISTLEIGGNNVGAIIQPVFRGEIQSVFLESGGERYGSEEIINFNRQPLFELSSGSGASLKPIINNGKIVKIIVNSSGNGYISVPNLKVNGSGYGVVLTPILSNGKIVDVVIVSSGTDYDDNTTIDVISSGNGAKFEADISSWNINIVERLLRTSKINDDDGILVSGLNNNYGLQYTHAYAPRNLRSSVQSTIINNGEPKYISDLILDDDGVEIISSAHSPIIGWAYDGNPIYGPYGYSDRNAFDSSIRPMVSGYKQIEFDNLDTNRPSTSLYPIGFFIEDYEYTNTGDLDEHNGRFCITPDYPNGVYAYFATIGNNSVLFNKNRIPTFPYVIGPSYKSKPIDFNFNPKSNQDSIDINDTGWKRNTTPYNLLENNSSYNYILNPNDIRNQNSVIKNISSGSVELIRVIDGGENYKVGDKILFSGGNTKSNVSFIEGKEISQISVATSSYENVTLYPNNNFQFIGFTTIPHNYTSSDLITFNGKNGLESYSNIRVYSNYLVLNAGVGSAQYTGIVTYFSVSGNLNYPDIRENDIYQIGDEQVKVLNVDAQSSRIRVLRNQNGTSGIVSYSSGIGLTEKTRRFFADFKISTYYNSNVERELYFDPIEVIGIGTTSGVGIVTTIYFSNSGVGITQITIPTQTIYLPNHNLFTGDSLIYSSNGGTGVSISTDGISSFQLEDNSTVYVAKFTNNLIGISTIKVGLGSTGTFVGIGTTSGGILYFTSVGTGNTHSFKTNYQNSLDGIISKNVVTVSTAETHGLSLGDNIILDVKVGVTTTIKIKYDDYNRRILVNPKTFSTIDIAENTISIEEHRFFTGQKVIYESNSPSVGLNNKGIYYVVVVDSNKFKLSNTYYDSIKTEPNTIEILTSSSGTISQINPPISFIKNESISFDLSDSSLSFLDSNTLYSAFEFKLFQDSQFLHEYDSSESNAKFDVERIGKVGIDSNARLNFTINNSTPKSLYYNLIPINLGLNLDVKKEIIVDSEVTLNNSIQIKEIEYNTNQKIVGVSSTSFSFNVLRKEKYNLFTKDSDNLAYYTNSTSASGPIKDVFVSNKSNDYKVLPGITSIISDSGSGAILLPTTNSIGKVSGTEIQDIGFDYSSDLSIRPKVKISEILRVDPLSSFDYIGISSVGRNYTIAPSLVVLDGLTNELNNKVVLKYNLGDPFVTIIKNAFSLNNVNPKIIPIKNSNGIKIKNIEFNQSTKIVTVSLDKIFDNAEDFPFEIGSKVLIEDTSVGLSTDGKGYNSSNYNYSLFTLTGVTPSLGGIGANVSYSLSSYLSGDEYPGNYNNTFSSGKIIPESYFPIFDIVLKKNNFINGERVYSQSSSGIVENWDPINQYLTVSSVRDFETNELVNGETSSTVGDIVDIIRFEGEYNIGSTSDLRKGWKNETGFLNNGFQRVHDSDYYQYFSYELRSKKDFDDWNNPVSSLNHTVGFKKFGNLLIESQPFEVGIGSTQQDAGDFSAISDLSSVVNLNCINDFDLVRENNFNIDNLTSSNEVSFNSRIVQDYIKSKSNRVLVIDNIEDLFNSVPRETAFSIVESFVPDSARSKKYIIYVRDKYDQSKSELNIVSLIRDDNLEGFINQYGINSSESLGSFDFESVGAACNLLFYPIKSKFNDYHIQLFSFSLNDSVSGVGSLPLGDVALINTTSSIINAQDFQSTPIVSISSTYRSSKILVQIGSSETGYYEYDEITYVHDGNEVHLLDYGQLSTDSYSSGSSVGIGTYDAHISGGNVEIYLSPTEEEIDLNNEYTINTLNVSIADTSSSGIGTQIIEGSSLNSSIISIAASTSPVATAVGSYQIDSFNGSYCILTVEDKTNSEYQTSEVLVISDLNDCYSVEFGIVQTNSSLGIVTAGISTSETRIYFTPVQDIDVDVRLFKIDTGLKISGT